MHGLRSCRSVGRPRGDALSSACGCHFLCVMSLPPPQGDVLQVSGFSPGVHGPAGRPLPALGGAVGAGAVARSLVVANQIVASRRP